MTTDQRLIEDYLPIEAISAEAKREKSIRKGHISTLHLWWARRPLVACRAAVYGALVPAPTAHARRKRAEFVADLCTYPGPADKIADARRHILEAHAARLSEETGQPVTVADIEAGRAPRPRVLDMFAGGGAIPLEALRLGCEAHALELNPVAHLIELCTLVYPQQYGAPDPNAKGSAKDGTWAGLAKEVEHWGKWVLKRVKAEIGDLYPPIPVVKDESTGSEERVYQPHFDALGFEGLSQPPGASPPVDSLTPIAYLWTRTVRCKNPTCGGTASLARRTWLAKGKNYYAALKPEVDHQGKRVRYRLVEATTPKGLGFNPAAGSRGGNVPCPFCGTVADSDHVKAEGQAGRLGLQPLAVICRRPGERGNLYFSADDLGPMLLPNDEAIHYRIEALCAETGLTVPDELIETNPRSMDNDTYGLTRWRDLFTPRQLLALLSLCKHVHAAYQRMLERGLDEQRTKAVTSYLGLIVDKVAQRGNTMCSWDLTSSGGRLGGAFARQSLPMVWDFAEANPLGGASGDIGWAFDTLLRVIQSCNSITEEAKTIRGSATQLPMPDAYFDAVVTDPPYYDNVSYSNLSDFFYVWLKRSIGFLYPEHFAGLLTPKRKEAIAAFYRHDGDREQAGTFYENMLAKSLAEAHRVLKPNAPLMLIYAHKTTAGWATLVDALRNAGFVIAEAWPLHTELKGGLRLTKAMLASSIFLVARRREGDGSGAYETQVRPELEAIVRERVDTLWAQGVSGADLVIAAVGAGLRAFTRFARVEYANGQPVPADTFLAEVEGVVLETLLEKLFGVPRTGVARVDAATRFYVLWHYTYRAATIDAGEAIVFAYPQGVELNGSQGLTGSSRALVEKQRGKYRLRDFSERGGDGKLGLPDGAVPASLIDVLHRTLWLMENHPALLGEFLDQALVGRAEQLRLVAQTLAGPALAGEEPRLTASRGAEAAALRKLTGNWRNLVEENLFRRRGS